MLARNSSFGPKTSIAPGSRVNSRVMFNVGGVRFETHRSTLKAIPDTRLAWLTNSTGNNPDYDDVTGEYFFDRHPGVFNMILNYYRTGKLHAPTDVCGPLFEEELAFWGIDEKQIEPCCWSAYRAHRDAQETLADFDDDSNDDDSSDEMMDDDEIAKRFGIVNETSKATKGLYARWRPRVWLWLEDPNSSPAAKILAGITAVFVLLSIGTFCIETHPSFRYLKSNSTIPSGATVREMQRLTEPYLYLRVFEGTCMAYFTVDIIVRFVFCAKKKEHLLNILTWLDLLSVLSFYIRELIKGIDHNLESSDTVYFLNSLRLVMVFRILKLTRHFSGFKILGHTLKASAKELLLMILVLVIGVLTFACLIYYAEQVDEASVNDFDNIPVGFWWAVVTMTTLGYGDLYPRTVLGYIVGAVCALCGLLMLALPVPVIVNNFTLYYSHAQAKLKLPKKTRNTLIGAADALKASSTPSSSCSPSINGSVTSLGSCNHVKNDVDDDENYGGNAGDTTITNETMYKGEEGGSVDSGYKADTPQHKSSRDGVNVIFTDEVAASSPSRLAPSYPKRNVRLPRTTDSTTSVFCDDPSVITIVINDRLMDNNNDNDDDDDDNNSDGRQASTTTTTTTRIVPKSNSSSNMFKHPTDLDGGDIDANTKGMSTWRKVVTAAMNKRWRGASAAAANDVAAITTSPGDTSTSEAKGRGTSKPPGVTPRYSNVKRNSPFKSKRNNSLYSGHRSDDSDGGVGGGGGGGRAKTKIKGKENRRRSLFHSKMADIDV